MTESDTPKQPISAAEHSLRIEDLKPSERAKAIVQRGVDGEPLTADEMVQELLRKRK